jgi:hypothetical protein
MQKIYFKEELSDTTSGFQPEPVSETASTESFQQDNTANSEEQPKEESSSGTSAA